MVVIGSRLLIPAVEETALRLHIPDAIIAATLVAFGTSLPELVTAVTAVRKGHGALAIGNVLGADVLNVLFVSGAAAAVTRGGLAVPPQFFFLFFPSMLFVVLVLRVGVSRVEGQFSKGFGFVLLLPDHRGARLRGAGRPRRPDAIIAATLVAFGTSLSPR